MGEKILEYEAEVWTVNFILKVSNKIARNVREMCVKIR